MKIPPVLPSLGLACVVFSIPAGVNAGGSAAPVEPVCVTVDCTRIVNTMRGGIGASWHAMETPIPVVIHPVFGGPNHAGSGWGAYPPAEDEQAWRQIYRHAEWLGLDWNRVEIEQRVYEPERGTFTFDNAEMRILYRILDWHERHGADVFFQQMWTNVAWLAHPALRDDPIGRVRGAPADLEAFAEGLATLMEHLVKGRGYTCIKWLCITNEPGSKWGWWQAPDNTPLSIGPGLAAVRAALDRHGLASLPLAGPDRSGGIPDSFPGGFDYLDRLGAYDFHFYKADFDERTGGAMAQQERCAELWSRRAHAEEKPLFLAEFGTQTYGWNPDLPGPSSAPAMLAASELVLRLANAGVDAFNRWSFLNRGNLDGQWQYVDTWDPRAEKLLEEFQPHPDSYFCLGLLSRFTAKNSSVLASRVEGGRIEPWPRVFCGAFRSPKGHLTIAIVNDAPVDYQLQLSLAGLPRTVRFLRYRYGEPQYGRTDVKVGPGEEFPVDPSAAVLADTLPRGSLTLYSTYRLGPDAPGIVNE